MITRRDAVYLLFLLLCGLMLFAPVIFTGNSFFLRDITFLFHPWKALSTEMVVRGEMPLWDPYAYCGMPLLANWQSAILYPFSLFFYLFPFVHAMKLYHLCHLFLAGFFAYIFARNARLPRHAAAGIMIIAALNGYMVTRVEFLSHYGADAWFFCLLLAARSPLLLGGAFSLCLLSGHPVSFIQAGVVTAYAIFRVDEHGSSYRGGIFAAAGLICAAGIAAAQLLPTAELAHLAARIKSGLDSVVAMTYSLSIRDISGILTPFLVPRSSFAVTGEKFFWGTSCWIGIVASICAAAGAIGSLMFFKRCHAQAPNRLCRNSFFVSSPRVLSGIHTPLFWTAAALAGVVLSMGSATPVYPWLLLHIPFFGFFRYPSQFMLISVNALAILTGYGLSAVRPRYGIALTALIAVELLVTGSGFQITAPAPYFHQKPALVSALQAERSPVRILLSPGTEKDRRMHGETVPAAWQAARGYLYNLVSLPYHVGNAYGFGEPLAPADIDSAVDAAYRHSSVNDSILHIERLGVTHIISRTSAGYEALAAERTVAPYMYRLPLDSHFRASEPGAIITDTFSGSYRAVFTTRSDRPFVLEWKDTNFPGWEIYINGTRSSYAHADTPFRVVSMREGEQRVSQIYNPGSWKTGLLISLFTIIICMFCGIIKIQRITT